MVSFNAIVRPIDNIITPIKRMSVRIEKMSGAY